ncbi:centrosomal protein of 97 kDa isoform X2 [Sardina pilchardus]|uniref:centrosomal protein of 97 kDa isoform X2 n=1 Tax=Sardina pilchardus TaxID=27697 RepID=UPI002E0DF9F3
MANVTTEKPLSPLSCMQSRRMDGLVVDLSDHGLNKLDSTLFSCVDTHTLILDNNSIIKLENLDQGTEIKQLSVASNRLVRMMGVSKLRELRLLNLPNNSIGYIEGLKDLVHLEWLNLAGNNLKVMDELNNCVGLQYLDLSDNNISVIGDLTKLSNLKTLHLNGNTITTLRSVPAFLPSILTVLALAENEIKDLNEVSYLGSLHSLEQLSIVGNPCVMASSTLAGSDYRPYVVSWCLKLKVLDGYAVSQKEELKAEWMYSQGKGHSYRPGQHDQLVQYLASVCPLTVTTALQSAEDAKLERILNKQRQHQKQLLRSDHRSSSSRAHPVPFNMEQQTHESSERMSSQPPSLIYRAEPVVQVNSWVGTDPSAAPIFYPGVSPSRGDDFASLRLEDVQTDEEKLHGSQLSSESFFLPVTSTAHPPVRSVDVDRETEPFTVISQAPAQSHVPAQPARDVKATRVGQKTPTYSLVVSSPTVPHENCSPSVSPGEKHSVGREGSACSQAGSRNCAEVNGEQGRLASESAPAENGGDEPRSLDAAAVRIQAWWRGHWTRLCHPQAKEVRAEIRLRRMQEHILYLTAELERVHKQQEEERLQRLVQEEAVKCLWKQLQSVVTWQNAVMEQLKCGPVLPSSRPFAPSENQAPTQTELHSYVDHQGAPQDSISSKVTVNSPELVSPVEAATAAAAQSNAVESSQGSIEELRFSLEQKEQE